MQISDSHLGFDKPANPNVTATLQEALDDVGKLPKKPAFMIHTGDITHLSKPAQFDTAAQMFGSTKLTLHTVPGEHDILEEDGKSYLNRFGKGTKGDGWYSFDAGGVHFIGLVNVVNLQGNGLGALGHEQLEWLEKRREAPDGEHADRGVRACAAVDRSTRTGAGAPRTARRRCPT